jgi:ornithine cyclodeaminase/alanine dehydrogenase-like protein (mu-crystallin family)
MKTLVISKQEISSLLSMSELIQEIREAYVVYSQDKTVKQQRTTSQINETSIVVNMPGCLPGSSMFTVKVNTKVPTNLSVGLPFLIGTILLIDQKTGRLLAIMDSGPITAMRTGAAGAIGVECLANPNAKSIALIGAGVQAEWQIKALHAIGRVSNLYIYDMNQSQSKKLSHQLSNELGIYTHIASSIKEAISQSDIAIITTPSKNPIITSDILHSGLHINAFGADQPGKVEIDAEVLNKNLVIVDDNDLALTDGTLNVAYKNKLLTPNQHYPEIGEVIQNKLVGRSSKEQITIFGNVGLAFQDLIACSLIYKKALNLKKGTWIDLDNSIT